MVYAMYGAGETSRFGLCCSLARPFNLIMPLINKSDVKGISECYSIVPSHFMVQEPN